MNGTIATIVTLLGALCGIGGLYVSWRTSKASAKKDEVEALRGIIAELEAEVGRWKQKYNELRQEHDKLRQRVMRTGLDPDDRPMGQLTMPEHSQGGGG